VRAALGFGRIVARPDAQPHVDVTVLLGPDYLPKLPLHP
jgi:hypothetical protein